jgi:hypothetical protein
MTTKSRPDLTEADELADRYMISRRFGELTSELHDNGMILRRIATALEKIEKSMNRPSPQPDSVKPDNAS